MNTIRPILQIGSTQIVFVSLFAIILIRNIPKRRSSISTESPTNFSAIYVLIDSPIVLTVILLTTVRNSRSRSVGVFMYFDNLVACINEGMIFLTFSLNGMYEIFERHWEESHRNFFLEFIKSIKYSALDSTWFHETVALSECSKKVHLNGKAANTFTDWTIHL